MGSNDKSEPCSTPFVNGNSRRVVEIVLCAMIKLMFLVHMITTKFNSQGYVQ